MDDKYQQHDQAGLKENFMYTIVDIPFGMDIFSYGIELQMKMCSKYDTKRQMFRYRT